MKIEFKVLSLNFEFKLRKIILSFQIHAEVNIKFIMFVVTCMLKRVWYCV